MKRIIPWAAALAAMLILSVASEILLNGLLREQSAQAKRLFAVLERTMDEDSRSTVSLEQLTERLAETSGCRVTLLARDGTLLADSGGARLATQFSYSKEILQAKLGEWGAALIKTQGGYHLGVAGISRSLPEAPAILRLEIAQPLYYSIHLWRTRFWSGTALLGAICSFLFILGIFRQEEPGAAARDTNANPPRELERLRRVERYANRRISLFSTILNSLDGGVILFDRAGSLVMLNPQAKNLLGIGGGMLFPGSASNEDAASSPLYASLWEQVKDCLSGRREQVRDVEIDLSIYQLSTAIIVNKYEPFEECGVLATVREVTRKRQLERQRSEFYSNVSHELRTPLTLISGFAETLRDWRGLDEEDRDRALEIIMLQSERLSQMIGQLLRLSSMDSYLLQDMPLTAWSPYRDVNQALPAAGVIAERKGISLLSDIRVTQAQILQQEGWLLQVVTNLCENAVKYTGQGGAITLAAWDDGASFYLAVRDNGMGIPEEDRQRVFERFYRAEKSRNSSTGGSGLGLAITRGLVETMGGSIRLESELGKGSEFAVTIPLYLRIV